MPNSAENPRKDYRHPDYEITPEMAEVLGIDPQKEKNWKEIAKAMLQGDPSPLVLDNRR